MARPRRIQFEGAFYHIFNRGVEKRPIFLDERDYKTFLHLLAETASEFQLRIFAYCLMKNHYHLFLQTLRTNLSQTVQNLQGRYAQYFNFRNERVGSLFQGRYKSRLVDEERYSLQLARYIHRNPQEAGMVQHLEDYPWSSYPCYVGTLPTWHWLDSRWLLTQFHRDPKIAREYFRQFHQEAPPEPETLMLSRMDQILGNPNRVRPHGV